MREKDRERTAKQEAKPEEQETPLASLEAEIMSWLDEVEVTYGRP